MEKRAVGKKGSGKKAQFRILEKSAVRKIGQWEKRAAGKKRSKSKEKWAVDVYWFNVSLFTMSTKNNELTPKVEKAQKKIGQ